MTDSMSAWKKTLYGLSVRLEGRFDDLKSRLRTRLGLHAPVQLVPYAGYGTSQQLYLTGRVLAGGNRQPAREEAAPWENILAMYRRFESDEVPGVRVQAQFRELVQEATTDEEGYFSFTLPLTNPLPADRIWHDVALSLLDEVMPNQGPVEAVGRVLVPLPQSQFGIISDIDDTIVESYATAPLKMARITFLNNARTRLPFEGVAAFYRALQDGADGTAFNPIFYVSSSPWNLYDLLADFMAFNDIPAGPLFLRDLGVDRNQFISTGHHQHKLSRIDRIMQTYPYLPFILIGDSGQKDPEIYAEVVRKYPGRIAAIYIRDVTQNERDSEIKTIISALGAQKVGMLLAPDTAVAAEHAASRGFIDAAALPAIRTEKIKDAAATEDQDAEV